MENQIRINLREYIIQLFSRILAENELDKLENYKKFCNTDVEQLDEPTSINLTKIFAQVWSSNDNDDTQLYLYKVLRCTDDAYPESESIVIDITNFTVLDQGEREQIGTMSIQFEFSQEDTAMVYIVHSESNIDPEAFLIHSLSDAFPFLEEIEQTVLSHFKQD